MVTPAGGIDVFVQVVVPLVVVVALVVVVPLVVVVVLGAFVVEVAPVVEVPGGHLRKGGVVIGCDVSGVAGCGEVVVVGVVGAVGVVLGVVGGVVLGGVVCASAGTATLKTNPATEARPRIAREFMR